MPNQTYEFDIAAVIDAAQATVTKFASTTQKQLDGISMATTISAIHDGFELIGETVGPIIDKVKEVFNEAISAGLEAEKAEFQLANALRLTGDAAGGSAENFQSLAEQLSRTTTFSVAATESAIGLAKQYQLTNSEAERAIKVAQDLSAATGVDLNTAMTKIGATFEGFVSRDLGKLIPGLKNLTTEALLNGQALGLIGQRVNGTADALGNTFGGTLISINNAAHELYVTLGSLFTDNSAIKAGLKIIRDALLDLNDTLSDNSESAKQLVTDGFVYLVQLAPTIISVIQKIGETFNTLATGVSRVGVVLGAFASAATHLNDDAAKRSIFQAMQEDLDTLDAQFYKTQAASDAFFAPLLKAAQDVGKKVEAAARSTHDLSTAVDEVGASTTGFAARFADKYGPEQIAEFTQKINALRSSLDTDVQGKLQQISSSPIESIIKFTLDGGKELNDAKAKIDQSIASIVNDKNIPDSFKQQAKDLAENAKQGLEDAFSNTSLGLAIGTSLVGDIQKGAAGASEAVAGVAGGVATAFFGPVAGQFVKAITGFLAQGADQVRQQTKAFLAAVPDVIEAIIQAVPALVEAIIDNVPVLIKKILDDIPVIINAFIKEIPNIVDALVAAVPQIIQALVEDAPKIAIALATAMPLASITFITELIKQIPNIITEFVKHIPDMVKGFADGLIDAAKQFVQAILHAVSGGLAGGGGKDGGGGFLSGVPVIGGIASTIGNVFGFADGGRIPDLPQYANDGARAHLSGGEQVLSKDLSTKLENYLANGGSGGDVHVTAQIVMDRKVLAQQMFLARKAGYRL